LIRSAVAAAMSAADGAAAAMEAAFAAKALETPSAVEASAAEAYAGTPPFKPGRARAPPAPK
jgi:hypothetical protein